MMENVLNQKIKLNLEDIVHHESCPCNIYNSKGKVICKRGEVFNAKLLNMLSSTELFRLVTPKELSLESEKLSRISKETSDSILALTKEFFDSAIENKKPSIKAAFKTRDIIYELVQSHYNETKHIEELRLFYNQYYFSHIINVSILSTVLGLKLGFDDSELKDLTLGALLHDVGMTRMPKDVLDKPWELTKSEYDLIKLHPRIGYKMIRDEYYLEEKISVIALEHHERFNGSGYPRGLDGDKINFFAQIVSIADVYDAAASNKVYATSKEPQNIAKELLKLSKSFRPNILQTMIYLIEYKS